MIWAEDLIRFEERIKKLFAEGELPFLVHLCGGNEAELISIFSQIEPQDWVLASHRNHYHYLLKAYANRVKLSAAIDNLEQMIRRGKSMFVFDNKINFITSAILGGVCGIAAGIALGIQEKDDRDAKDGRELKDGMFGKYRPGSPRKFFRDGPDSRVWCFIGDGAFDNGHAFEAIMFVEARDLPCVFVIEDNDRSVDTTKRQRSGERWRFPFNDFKCVRRYCYAPTYPHGGAGLKTMIEFKKEAIERYLHQGSEGNEAGNP